MKSVGIKAAAKPMFQLTRSLIRVEIWCTLARALFVSILTLSLLLAGSAYATNIVEITSSPMGTPFLLDDKGQVWTFRKPLSLEETIKLPKLNHIKKIAPYIAIDTNGNVFTWRMNLFKSYWDEVGLQKAAYTTPQRVQNLQGVTMVASDDWFHFAAVIGDKEIVDWEVIQNKSPLRMHYGPIRSVISRMGVRAVIPHWLPEVISTENVVTALAASSLVALFDDGAVIGWGD